MGQVFLARDPTLERQIALKLLNHETEAARRLFQEEAKALAALSHPNIVTIFEIAEVDGQQFIAMEYLPGKSLRDLLQHDKPSRDRVLSICAQVAMAVNAAHAAGILHRDIKPENVVVGDPGVKVVDFGIARRLGRVSVPTIPTPKAARVNDIVDAFMQTLQLANPTIDTSQVHSATQTVFGTPAYMAPEVLLGQPSSPASDVYSLGVMLHECLIGRRPYDAPHLHEVIARVIDDDTPPPLIDDPLGELVAQMLDRDPLKRPGLTTVAKTLVRRQSTISSKPPRRRWIVPLFAAIALGALVAAGLAISRTGNSTISITSPTIAPPDAAVDRGKLAIRNLWRVYLPSYGAQPTGPRVFSRIIAMLIELNNVPVIGPELLEKNLPQDATDEQWNAAALKLGATFLGSGTIVEKDGALIANLTITDLRDHKGDGEPSMNASKQLQGPLDVPALLDDVGEWFANQSRPGTKLDRNPNPGRSDKFLEKIGPLMPNNGFLDARAYAEQAVHADPKSAEAWGQFAAILGYMGAPETSTMSAYEHALELAPEGPRKHILHAALLLERHDPEAALAELVPLEKSNLSGDDLRDLMYQLGEAHWHDGHHDLGFGYFKRVLELYPSFTVAAVHAGEYTLGRRKYEEALRYVGIEQASPDWVEFAMGHYEALARSGRQPFSEWSQLILDLPRTNQLPASIDPALGMMDRAARAVGSGDLATAKRELDALFAHVAAGPYTGGSTNALVHMGELAIIADMADETRKILDILRAKAPHYSYRRLSIVASPLVGKPELPVSPTTDRLRALSVAFDAELAGDHAKAAKLLDVLVDDPTGEWDLPERVALVRNLRALGRKSEADAACAEISRPVVMRYAFTAARRYCLGH